MGTYKKDLPNPHTIEACLVSLRDFVIKHQRSLIFQVTTTNPLTVVHHLTAMKLIKIIFVFKNLFILNLFVNTRRVITFDLPF